ncbi:MAG: type II secretion system F family protein [Phycisphaerales bacterium]
MTVWRYTAVPLKRRAQASASRGELAGESAAEVRASLRRIGLQVIDLRPLRRSATDPGTGIHFAWLRELHGSIRSSLERYFRGRRRHERAELYDALATMLDSGLPLLEAVDTIIGSTKRRRCAVRSLLVQVREQLRGGSSLADAITAHRSWFDASEVAMIEAGQLSGTLPRVLRTLAERHERSGELSNKLIGALAYPAIVAMVGLGVVIFLSVKTLPDLTQILTHAGIDTPALTAKVMALGQFLAGHWLALIILTVGVLVGLTVLSGLMAKRQIQWPDRLRRLYPKVLRRIAVARVSLQLAELLRAGVPVVDALRVLAPTSSRGGSRSEGGGASGGGGGGRGSLARQLHTAADRVERGDELAAALDDEQWFDGEFRQLLAIGQATGELDSLLERIGRRYARQAERLIDRLAALLEPSVILTLAVLVGLVVMAAILPLLRLQEVL